MDYRILGSFEVRDGRRLLPLAGAKQQAVLAFLLLHANEVVPTDRLLDELWGEPAPKTARAVLRNQISKLRKVLGHELLVTIGPGYIVRVEPGELDVDRFESLVRDATACNGEARAWKLREALSLWRGPALSDFSYEPFAQSEIARLEELRLAALESRIDTELALGLHSGVVAELEALVARYPVRERFLGQLMLALYRSGRQTEALLAYRDGRQMLRNEFGLEPTESLRQLERAVLLQDPMLDLDRRVEDARSADVLERAVSLVATREDHVELLTEFGVVLDSLGLIPSSDVLLTRAMERAVEVGDAPAEMKARLARSAQRLFVGRESQAGLLEAAEQAIALFERISDDGGLAKAWLQVGHVRRNSGRSSRGSTRAYERSLSHAREAGDSEQEYRILSDIAINLVYGPCPAPKAIARCEEILNEVRDSASVSARVVQCLALLYAMRGRFEEGRLLCEQSKATLDQLGLKRPLAWVALSSGPLELFAGDAEAAERELHASYELLDSIGERGALPHIASLLAHALHHQGRDREAEKFGRMAQEIAAEDDLEAQIPWRTARAAALAGLGSPEKAEAFAREAIALAEPTDWYVRAETHITLAHVLATAGRRIEATAAARRALDLENQKGNIVGANAALSYLH